MNTHTTSIHNSPTHCESADFKCIIQYGFGASLLNALPDTRCRMYRVYCVYGILSELIMLNMSQEEQWISWIRHCSICEMFYILSRPEYNIWHITYTAHEYSNFMLWSSLRIRLLIDFEIFHSWSKIRSDQIHSCTT